MTIVSSKLPLLNKGRKLIQAAGLRNTRVWVRLVPWSGGSVGLGEPTAVEEEIIPRPEVIKPAPEAKALVLSGITQAHEGGGWAPIRLQPAIAAGQDYYFIVQGPDGIRRSYKPNGFNVHSAFTIDITIEPMDRVEPDLFEDIG